MGNEGRKNQQNVHFQHNFLQNLAVRQRGQKPEQRQDEHRQQNVHPLRRLEQHQALFQPRRVRDPLPGLEKLPNQADHVQKVHRFAGREDGLGRQHGALRRFVGRRGDRGDQGRAAVEDLRLRAVPRNRVPELFLTIFGVPTLFFLGLEFCKLIGERARLFTNVFLKEWSHFLV
mgnify:CR=1 FL=1